MKLYNYLYTLVLIGIVSTATTAKVITYSPPAEIQKNRTEFMASSRHYQVEVVQDGRVTPCFVYEMQALQYTNVSKTTAWAQFDFEGPVTVRVTRLEAPVKFCQVLPSSKNITVRKEGNRVEFDLERPGQFSVEFQQGVRIDHPLLIFADPLEKNVPSPDDPGVIYFKPGIHTLEERLHIPSGKTVYLAGGAYVKGQFTANGQENLRIRGRGILSGEDFAVRTGSHMVTLSDVENVVIEGITIIHAPKWCVRLSGRNHIVRNVKMMGWWFSTDGVQTGDNGLIEDCFFKVNDDTIKLYNSNTTARRNVIWQMENGSAFMIGWSRGADESNFHAYDCDVIRVEHEWDNENLAVFCAVHGGSGHMRRYLYEDIRIENSNWRIFRIVTKPNRWAGWNPERGNISDIVFRNISFTGQQRVRSLFMGHDQNHRIWDFSFDNLVINGEKILNAEAGNIFVDPETTSGFVFK